MLCLPIRSHLHYPKNKAKIKAQFVSFTWLIHIPCLIELNDLLYLFIYVHRCTLHHTINSMRMINLWLIENTWASLIHFSIFITTPLYFYFSSDSECVAHLFIYLHISIYISMFRLVYCSIAAVYTTRCFAYCRRFWKPVQLYVPRSDVCVCVCILRCLKR